MFSTNISKPIFVSVFPMLQYPVHHPASQHRITDGSLFCQTCNSAISWRVTHETAVEFSKRPVFTWKAEKMSLASTPQWPLDRKAIHS